MSRYAIDSQNVDWTTAESQVSRLAKSGGGKSTVISLKSNSNGTAQKRKVGETIDGNDEAAKKKTRRGKKAKR